MESQLTIQWEGKPCVVTLRSLTYGQYKKIKRATIKTNEEGKQYRDADEYDELMILASIVTAPFEKISENLNKLSIQDGRKLEEAVEKLNFPK